MEDGVLSPGTMLFAPGGSVMDFDFMDELLLEGCWLETTDGSEFLNPNATSASFLDPSFVWPTSETNNGDSISCQSQTSNQEDRQMSPLADSSPLNEQGTIPVNAGTDGQNGVTVAGMGGNASFAGLGSNAAEDSDISRRWWIEPRTNPGPGTSVRERLIRAIGYIQDFAKAKDALIQVWVPVNRGGRCVLTTHDQPFALDPNCQRLASYRDISVNYQFLAEEDSKDLMGMPGRVFLNKVPEWTPDVRFFRSEEYQRVAHAQRYDVCGTLALPVFEQGSRTCLGVIEVVTTMQKIQYSPELESVCKALEAVDLRSSEVLNTRKIKVCDMSYQAALPEILEVLKSACETHRLPLAQTWVSCIQQGKGGCRHSDENYFRCVSTVDHACYVAEPGMKGFHDACSEHHLLKGQGVVGEAFMTNQPCFSSDITSYKKTEFPLSHHARMFGLRAAVAIRFRSVQTGAADFVLEFFLPVECTDPEEQKKMLTSLSIIIQQVCRNLRVVTDEELQKETNIPVSEVIVSSDGRPSREETFRVRPSCWESYATDNLAWTPCITEVPQSGSVVPLCHNKKQKVIQTVKSVEFGKNQEEYHQEGSVEFGGDSKFAEGSFSSVCMGKRGEKKRAKAEKQITLQVLRQYFAGSLKDAAKNIGVCPTTLKRICRQHGISRWPSRKIKKVGHSLQKIQFVIDSVQGASGALQIGSFYSDFPELASPNSSGTSPISTSKKSDHPKPSSIQPKGGIFSSQAAAPKSPSSSCSQSSSSSHCCSSGTQQNPSKFTAASYEDPKVRKKLGNCAFKRVRSDAELHASSLEEQKSLPRSQSHEYLKEQANLGNLPPLPKGIISQVSQDIDAHRVKITYGNEKIRLRMRRNWAFKDLVQEIARRFNIDDMSIFDMKYLDDDSEWVLLTCDDDLEECIDLCRSSQNNTIRLSLQVSPHHLGRTMGSSGPP